MSHKWNPINVSLTFKISLPPKLSLTTLKRKHKRQCMSRHTFPSKVKIPVSYLFDFALRDFFFIFFSSNIKCQSHLHVLGATKVKVQTYNLLLFRSSQ